MQNLVFKIVHVFVVVLFMGNIIICCTALVADSHPGDRLNTFVDRAFQLIRTCALIPGCAIACQVGSIGSSGCGE